MPPSKLNSRNQAPAGKGTGVSADTQPIAVLAADLQGKIRSCNQEAPTVFGCSREDVLSRTIVDFISTDMTQRPELKTILASVQKDGHYRSSCEGAFSGDACITVLQDENSTPTGIILWFTAGPKKPSVATVAVRTHGEDDDATAQTVSRKVEGTNLILASPVMHRFMRMVDRVAGHSESVLITGETGTGKELIAHTIHQSSSRRSRPWVDINCAALPENLVESELFGYEKGAFSGADSSKPGLFELADRGTLFLDEIGELQLQTQVKLLRVLDGQPFYRLGGNRKIKVDVRIVAATNQDLEAAVKGGRFRQDLFHRLGQFQLRVPPLRERPEDIVALAEHFLRLKAPNKIFSEQAISALLSHPWPGNIRELRNLVARMAMESAGLEIDFTKLTAALTGEPAALRQTASMPVSNLDSMEEQMIIKALERTGGQRTQAAEQLGISRRTLSRKLKEYNINFAPGETTASLSFISNEQQKFFRARVDIPVTIRNSQGEEIHVRGMNLSTGGMGLDGLKEPLRFAGMVDRSFVLPESDIEFQAKARLMWVGDEGRVGVRFAVIEPALFEQLQHWTNRKMKEEGWDFTI